MVGYACGCLVGVPPGDEVLPVFTCTLFRHVWARQFVGFGLLTGAGDIWLPVHREKCGGLSRFNIPRGVGTSFNGAIEHHHGWRTRVAVNRSNFSGRKDWGRTFWSNYRARMECGRILLYLLYGSVASLPSPSSNIEAWPYGTSLRFASLLHSGH